MRVDDYVAFAAQRIAQAIIDAWNARADGGIGFGQGYAIVGRNRRWVNEEGQSTMYNLNPSVHDTFRYIEGYEDHSVNLLGTFDSQGELTGLIINIACPSQETESKFVLSADWWYETRMELRRRFGEDLFILPQCSVAGDLSSHLLYDKEAHARMLRLRGRTGREEIAYRIANAVEDVLPYIRKEIYMKPVLRHLVGTVELPMNRLTAADVQLAEQNAKQWRAKFEEERRKLEEHPELRNEPRWYVKVTSAYRRMNWYAGVARRYEWQQAKSTQPVEVHVIRLGDLAFATNPFELYLDFGIQIKVRSSATQTFLVQLCGSGTYVPSPRSVMGGGYGSVPASNPFGSEAGHQLVDYTVSQIRSLWED